MSLKIRNGMITYYGDEVPPKPDFVGFVVGQREQCPTTNRLHYQMYVELKNQERVSRIQQWLPGAHVEKRRGTQLDAIKYVTKVDTRVELPFEDGEKHSQGQRTDMEECLRLVREDGSSRNHLRRAYEEKPRTMIHMGRRIEEAAAVFVDPRDYKPHVKVYYGPTGTGKSERARRELPDAYVWMPQNGKWFTNYFAQEDVIFEEFRGQLSLGEMLMHLDKYSDTVEIKGGFREFRGRNIIITSPKHPRDWYANAGDDKVDQLLRRIDEIIYTGPDQVLATPRKRRAAESDPLDVGVLGQPFF